MQELFIPTLAMTIIAIASRSFLIYIIAGVLWYLTLK